MVRWCNTVVLLVLAVAVVRTMTVECNYSIASGGGKAATSEIKGNKQDAKEKVHQTLEEANETAVTWTDWAKDKIQGVLGLVGISLLFLSHLSYIYLFFLIFMLKTHLTTKTIQLITFRFVLP